MEQTPVSLAARRDELRALRSTGLTLREIAERYHVSRARVHQIIGNTGYVKEPQHGKRYRYREGCRCDLCVEAERAHKRAQYRRRRARELGALPGR